MQAEMTLLPVRRASMTGLGLAVVGLAASTYLTIEHFTASTTLVCPNTGAINCAKVTTSRWAQFAGVPVAVFGVGYFVVMVALMLPVAWRHPELDPVRVAVVAAGCLGVVYFVWVELFRVNAICIWCTVVHASIVGLLGTVLWRTGVPPDSGV